MDNVNTDTILALGFRHAMGVAAGWLIAAGYVPGTITKEQVVGAGMVAGAIVLSWWNKRGYALLMAEKDKILGNHPSVMAPK